MGKYDEISYTEWPRKAFAELPERKWDEEITCDSIVIIPTRRKHSSGYMVMDAAAIKDGKPICRLSGCSDVIHIDGIGGFGQWHNAPIPASVPPKGWNFDCLIGSGYLQLWPSHGDYEILVSQALSSLEIFGVKKSK